MEKKKVLVVGCSGRMGKIVCQTVIKSEEFELMYGFDVVDKLMGLCAVTPRLGNIAERPDVIIDFSSPEATEHALRWAAVQGIPMVIATTGLSDTLLHAIRDDFSANMPIFLSSNMSYQINLMTKVLQILARKIPGCEIEILEEHHSGKKDSPSGTAKDVLFPALNEALGYKMEMNTHREGKRKDNEIGIVALRGGDVSGTHTVNFYSGHEKLSVTHEAHSPEIFAEGALKAASFLLKQEENGFYTMDDLLGDMLCEDNES